MEVRLNSDSHHVARRIHGGEHAYSGIGKCRAFHIHAHKIVVARGAFGQQPQVPPRQRLVNRQAQLRELYRHVRVQLLLRQPVEELQISLAGGVGGSGFMDAFAQAVQRHHETFTIQAANHAQGVVHFLTGNESRSQATSHGIAGQEFLGTFALRKVEKEGAKHKKVSGARYQVLDSSPNFGE